MKRSEVYRYLGIPEPEIEYPKGFIGKVLRSTFGTKVDLDHGRGYSLMPPAKVYPYLNLRTNYGVEIIFDKEYRMKSIWFEQPFSLPVCGVKIGETEDNVLVQLGHPSRREAGSDFSLALWYEKRSDGTSFVYRFQNERVAEIAFGYTSEV